MRKPNEIDFWRGLALVSIFINHIPGFYFERFTHKNIGASDSAELFVFLAGWSVRLVAESSSALSLARLNLRFAARAVVLYAAQILITMLAIAMIAGSAIWLANPLLLEWHNAAAVFQDPVPTHIGLVLLTHQIGYFDILPLYVVLMCGTLVIVTLHRLAPVLVLPVALAVYGAALGFDLNLRTWPVDGVWLFNPLAWQLIFVLGFVVGGDTGIGGWVRRHRLALRCLGVVVVVAGAYIALTDYTPDPLRVPEPKLFFVVDKTYQSPARLLHFLALAATFSGSFVLAARFVPPLARFLSMLGRHSLNVFCVGSLLSLVGQLARFGLGGSMRVDTIVLIVGTSVLGLTAWLSELGERLRSRPSAPVSPS